LTDDFSFCVCTYNSGKTLLDCLTTIRKLSNDSRLIVVDHNSSDDTPEIASRFCAEVYCENRGLGHARQLCLNLAQTRFIVFVDSDVEILRMDFLEISARILSKEKYGAVVGAPQGHKFAYGLPASLLALRKSNFEGTVVPDYIDARETFFLQRRLNKLGLETFYVPNAIVHRSQYRRFKPEWEGANTRILPSRLLSELMSGLGVMILMGLNSRNAKNLAYIPVFYLRFLMGIANPTPWLRLKRE